LKLAWRVLGLCVFSYAAPLALIFIAAGLSPWFSFWSNALSDLGHATRSSVAPLFNFALVLGGFSIGLFSALYLSTLSRVKAAVGLYTGFSLTLVGVYDEVYGRIHFIVSVMFFLGVLSYLIASSIVDKTALPALTAAIQVAVWTVHFTLKTPPGAAIPELVAVLTMIPFYSRDAVRIASKLQQSRCS